MQFCTKPVKNRDLGIVIPIGLATQSINAECTDVYIK